MKQHKWHKEIKAWADGAEIEARFKDEMTGWSEWDSMSSTCRFSEDGWWEYRIKPQPIQTFKAPTDPTGIKEPQYLYVYQDLEWSDRTYKLCRRKGNGFGQYIGKIKLEDDE